jgi:hypothetical protein
MFPAFQHLLSTEDKTPTPIEDRLLQVGGGSMSKTEIFKQQIEELRQEKN